MWDTRLLTDAIAEALKGEEARLGVEQAVHGMDSRDELALHPVLAAGLAAVGLGVSREVEYPHEWKKKASKQREQKKPRVDIFTGEVLDDEHGGEDEDADALPSPDDALPRWRERQRCDLVLTHEPGVRVGDPVVTERARRAIRAEGAGTLFAPAARADAEALPEVAAGMVAPEDAFWLEVKMVCQFSNVSRDGEGMGVPGPNMSYGSQLVRGVTTDAKKLSRDGRITHGGVALLLFTCDEQTAEHDLVALLHTCLDKGLPIQSPTTERLAIIDRIGNRFCTVAVVPVRGS